MDFACFMTVIFFFLLSGFCEGIVIVGQEQGDRGGSWKGDESLKMRGVHVHPFPNCVSGTKAASDREPTSQDGLHATGNFPFLVL